MSKIDQLFTNLRREERKALMPFVTHDLSLGLPIS